MRTHFYYDAGTHDKFCDCRVVENSFSLGAFALGEIALGEIALGEIALGEIALGEVALGEIALGEFALGQVALGEIAVSEVALGEVALGEVALGKIALGEVALGKIALGKIALGAFESEVRRTRVSLALQNSSLVRSDFLRCVRGGNFRWRMAVSTERSSVLTAPTRSRWDEMGRHPKLLTQVPHFNSHMMSVGTGYWEPQRVSGHFR